MCALPGGLYSSVMKPWEKLLGAMLVQITREDKEGEEEILLDESRLFVRKLEELNARGREGGVFTIEIAEEDRPRRSRANRPLSSGRTVSPITKEWC